MNALNVFSVFKCFFRIAKQCNSTKNLKISRFLYFFERFGQRTLSYSITFRKKKTQKNVQTDSWVLGDSETHEFAWFLLAFCGNFQNFMTDCSRE